MSVGRSPVMTSTWLCLLLCAGHPRRLELVHNGKVFQTVNAQPVEGRHEAALECRLKPTEPGWIALRIPADAGRNEFDKPLFAHTGPIYIELDGKRLFRPDVARGLVAEMRHSSELINTKGVFASAEEREAVLGVYRDSIASLEKRIDEHGPGTRGRESAPRYSTTVAKPRRERSR